MAAEGENLNTVGVATEVFLDEELVLGPFDSFSEFQDLFPKGFKNHQDVRLLYRSFQKQRKILQKQVQTNIQQQCNPEAVKNDSSAVHNVLPKTELELHDAVRILEGFSQSLEEDNKIIKRKLKASETDIERLCSNIRDKVCDHLSVPIDDKYSQVLQDASNMLT